MVENNNMIDDATGSISSASVFGAIRFSVISDRTATKNSIAARTRKTIRANVVNGLDPFVVLEQKNRTVHENFRYSMIE